MSDEQILLQSLRNGDMHALAALFEAYADRIYRLAMGVLRDPVAADDVVQDTFLSLLTHLPGFEGRAKLSTWMYRVAYNTSIDRLRQRQSLPLPENDPDPGDGNLPMPHTLVDWALTPDQLLSDTETRAVLDAAMHALPENLRVVFMLRDIEELSTAETADALGISVESVKVRLHRARLGLRERLSEYFAERSSQAR